MFRITPIRTLTLLTLLSLGGSAVADAAPRPAAHHTSGSAWNLLSSPWPFLAAFLQRSACTFTPFGRYNGQPGAAVAATDEGCMIDPYGRCENQPPAAVAATDEGCMIDPEGRCKR